MTPESPLRAQADNRLSDTDSVGIQAGLFDADNFDDAHENSSLLSDYRQRYGLSEDPFPMTTVFHFLQLLAVAKFWISYYIFANSAISYWLLPVRPE